MRNNKIKYPSIFPGVHLKYIYKEKKLKEEIILTNGFRNNLPPPSHYGLNNNTTFLVVSNKIDFSRGLDLEDQDSTGISSNLQLAGLNNYSAFKRLKFKIRNKIKFMLPIDVAYLQQEDSTNVGQVVKLKRRIKRINGELNLLTGIKYNKLLQFPVGNVVLDPTIETEFVATHDTWLENNSVKGGQYLLILGKAAGYPKKRSLLKFDISGIHQSADILSSNLNVYYYGVARGSGAPGSFIERDIKANIVYTSWNEGSAKRDYPWHASYGVFGSSPIESDYYYIEEDEVHFDLTRQVWKTFNLTNATQKWVDGSLNNQGVVLWATNENDDGYDMRLRSSEYPYDETKRPYLEVNYRTEFARRYYLKDHLGNIRVTIDEDGDVVGYDDYYPFGLQMPGRSSNTANPNDLYKFSGKELDGENNLDWYYFGARYYDPAIARWLQVDPLASKYPSLSPYNYVANNPLIFFDPDGRIIYYHGTKKEQRVLRKVVNELRKTEEGSRLVEFADGKDRIVDLRFGKTKKGENATTTQKAVRTFGKSRKMADTKIKTKSVEVTLDKNKIKTTTKAVGITAHEFKHVEQAYTDPEKFNQIGKSKKIYNELQAEAERTESTVNKEYQEVKKEEKK